MANVERLESAYEHINTYNKRNRSEEQSEKLECGESSDINMKLVHASVSESKDSSTENDKGIDLASSCCSSTTCHTDSSTLLSSEREACAAAYEKEHVRDVYNAIASHFSATRYKAWPRIQEFLETLPPHVMIADVGCGNGKYFASCQRKREFNKNSFTESTPSQVVTWTHSNNVKKCQPCEEQTSRDCCSIKDNTNKKNSENNRKSNSMRSSMSINGDLLPTLSQTCHQAKASNKEHESNNMELLSVGSVAKAYPVKRYIVGLDVSENLLRLTQRAIADPNYNSPTENDKISDANHTENTHTSVKEKWKEPLPRTDVVCADGIHCPLRGEVFDVVICIAVIHHYSNVHRRKAAVQELLRLVHGHGGLVLIYVWALEGLKMPKGTSVVPTDTTYNTIYNENKSSSSIIENKNMEKETEESETEINTFSPLSNLESVSSPTRAEQSKIFATNRMRVNVESGDAMVRWETHAKFDPNQPIYHRYYHLFRQGELEELCVWAAKEMGVTIKIKNLYYDKEN